MTGMDNPSALSINNAGSSTNDISEDMLKRNSNDVDWEFGEWIIQMI